MSENRSLREELWRQNALVSAAQGMRTTLANEISTAPLERQLLASL